MSLNGGTGMAKTPAMDRRIVIQNYTVTTDYGTESKTYATFKTLWASREHSGVRENEEAQKETAKTIAHFYIRYPVGYDIDKDFRVIDEYGLTWDIMGTEEIGRRRFLRLTCELRE